MGMLLVVLCGIVVESVLGDVMPYPGPVSTFTATPPPPYVVQEGWTLATQVMIPWDLQLVKLQVKTTGTEGFRYCDVHLMAHDGTEIAVLTWETAGYGFGLTHCTSGTDAFLNRVPNDPIKVWTLHKTEHYLHMQCNGVEVVDLGYESAVERGFPECADMMAQPVAYVQFNQYNEVIRSYRVASHTDRDLYEKQGPQPPSGHKTNMPSPPGLASHDLALYHPTMSSTFVLDKRFGAGSLVDKDFTTFAITDKGDPSWVAVWFSEDKTQHCYVNRVVVYHREYRYLATNPLTKMWVELNGEDAELPGELEPFTCDFALRLRLGHVCRWQPAHNVYVKDLHDFLEISEIQVIGKPFTPDPIPGPPAPINEIELTIDMEAKRITSLQYRPYT